MKQIKPDQLDSITILMAFLNVGGYFMLSSDESSRILELTIATVIIIFSYWVLYKFNTGHNWARRIVLIVSVIAILNLTVLFEFTLVAQIIVIIEAILAIYLFFWLNKSNVKHYFLNKTEEI